MNCKFVSTYAAGVSLALALSFISGRGAASEVAAVDEAEREMLIERVGRQNIKTGILYDLVAPLSGIEGFDGGEASRTATLSRWKQLYYELYRADLSAPARPPLPRLMEMAARSAASGEIPVAIIDLAYNRSAGDGLDQGLAFAAAALKDRTYRGRSVTFILDRKWYYEGGRRPEGFSFERIEIDFSDGWGFREVGFGEPVTANYSSTGARVCRIRCEKPGGEVLNASFRFDVAALSTPAPHDTLSVTATVPYEGGFASGEAYVYLADSLQPISDPIVVLEGFDIDNTMFWDELYNDLNQEDVIERLRVDGFDVIVLNFFDSTDYIQRNAFVAVELIEQIISIIPQSNDMVLVGASMGGLCGRYALAWMEQNGREHHVRTYVSFDSPQRGANIPLGVQYWVKFFSIESAAAADMLSGLESNAARQMLEYHFTEPPGATGEADPLRGALIDEFYSLGGYPFQPRLVAIANGSGNMSGQGFSPQEQLILYEYSSFLVDIIGNVWAVPDGSSSLIFDGLIDRIWPLSDDQMDVTVTGTRPIDNAPGGSRPSMAQMDSTEAPYGDIIALQESHCFIPTISTLDLETDDLFYDVAGDTGLMAITPFDAVYYAAVNEPHVFISPECADWLIDQARVIVTAIEDEMPVPSGITLNQNRPNPFNPRTVIRFSISNPAHVNLKIYDAAGSLVRTLVDGPRPAGWYQEDWDGRDDMGRSAASGVYFYRLSAGDFSASRKMILLR